MSEGSRSGSFLVDSRVSRRVVSREVVVVEISEIWSRVDR